MSWFRKKRNRREELIADLVEAWNRIPAREKPDLMRTQDELYWAAAWLAAYETVKKEMKRR